MKKRRIAAAVLAALLAAQSMSAAAEEICVKPVREAAPIPISEDVFPDGVFRSYLKKYIDKNADGQLSGEETAAVTTMDINAEGVSDLTGISCFTGLTALDCGDNRLTSLDVSRNKALQELWCDKNALTSLDVSQNTALRALVCDRNQLTSLELGHNPALEFLSADHNRLTHLDVRGLNLSGTDADGTPKLRMNLGGQSGTADLQRIKGGWLLDLAAVTGSAYIGNVMAVSKVEGAAQTDTQVIFSETNVPETLSYLYMAGGRVCSRSDSLMKVDLTLTKLPCSHRYGEYTRVKEPTVQAEGLEMSICELCGDVQSRPVAKLKRTVKFSARSLPLQKGKSVSVRSLVTGIRKGDSILSFSSSKKSVAVVSASGKVTAKKKGTAVITVTMKKTGDSAALTVKVQDQKVKTAKITGLSKTKTVGVGKKITLKPARSPISSQDKFTYSTSNKKVAAVTSGGVVKGVKAGTANITVRAGSARYTVKVKVTAPAVSKIKNIPAKKTLKKGAGYKLSPRLLPAGSSAKVTYQSSNAKVAAVNSSGRITAKKKGSAVITVKAGKAKAVCRVTVK